MNFRRRMSLVGVVLNSLLMVAQAVYSIVFISSDAKAAKRRLPSKR